MPETFKNLKINQALIQALRKEQIFEPTEIQCQAIPVILENKDLIAQSATGTGKTLAYLLPVFERLTATKKGIQAVIMAPTHELVIQIQRQMERLSQNSNLPVKSTPVIGSANIARQIEKLKENPQIVIGSPGRILELMQKGKIPAHAIHTIVLDEADRLLDIQNSTAVLAVIKKTPQERQLLLFSATITQSTIDKAKAVMKTPVVIKEKGEPVLPASIGHYYFIAEKRDKIETLRKLLGMLAPEKALIFINKNDQIDILASKLRYHNFNAESIHGTNIKLDRKKIMDAFRNGKVKILIASDIAARGLQLDGITHIFNMDLPEDPKDYLHRAGRTGRNGNTGAVVSIVTRQEQQDIRNIENFFKIKIEYNKMSHGNIRPEEYNENEDF